MASRDEFVAAFPPLVKELLDELSSDFEMPPYAVHWIETVRLRSLSWLHSIDSHGRACVLLAWIRLSFSTTRQSEAR